MARKADKLRPYRVDYFDILEMKGDRALVRSAIVRSVTAQAARDQVLHGIGEDAPPTPGVLGRIIIRSYRYYKTVPTKETFKAVEDLFTVNKAIEVMETVEKFRAVLLTPVPVEVPAPTCPFGYTKEDEERGSMTLHNCDIHTNTVTDKWGTPINDLGNTQAAQDQMDALAEQADKSKHPVDFTLPDLPHFNLDAAAPIVSPAPTAVSEEDYQRITFPDKPVAPINDAVFDDSEYVLTSTESGPSWIQPPPDRHLGGEPMPLWLKLSLFGTVAFFAIVIVLAVLNCGH